MSLIYVKERDVLEQMPPYMRMRFTERAQAAIQRAQEEAARLSHNYIGTEHQLLGLVGDGDGVAALALRALAIDLESVRAEVENMIGRGQEPPGENVGPTPRANRVMELAQAEAKSLGHVYIGTEHLLLGLVAEGEGIAASILEKLGATLPAVRGQVTAMLRKDNVVTFRINSRDLEALDMLVEAGIRTTRSDAAAWLIHAGIVANKELFDRVGKTIGEIKRLRKEAQEMALGAASTGEGGA
jgi:ATP-dependent Clp protease ATP-binding subunit ClpA